MNIESFRDFCLAKPGTTESFPFDQKTLVFKVGGKMYALTDVDTFDGVNLKCDPEHAIDLRETYQGVQPGYHMNKQLWNTVKTNQDVPEELFKQLIDHSYELIVNSLPKRIKDEL